MPTNNWRVVKMLQRVASMLTDLFVTKTIVPPPMPKIVPSAPVPIIAQPLDYMTEMVMFYHGEGFEKVGDTHDGGVIMRTPDDRIQVSLHPDGRTTTSYKSMVPEAVH